MELTRAYKVLGVAGECSLEDARKAFVTWHHLYSGSDEAGWTDQTAVLALHELDVAWDTVERAHARTAMRWRRPPACEECNRGPALQVTFTRTMPGVRARTQSTTATLCRECGMELFEAVQRKNLRTGWWGVAAPFRNLRSVAGNKVEARVLRGIGEPQGRRPAAPDRFVAAAAEAAAAKAVRKSLKARRATPWITGIAAVAIAVGIAVPASGDHPAPTRAQQTQTQAHTPGN